MNHLLVASVTIMFIGACTLIGFPFIMRRLSTRMTIANGKGMLLLILGGEAIAVSIILTGLNLLINDQTLLRTVTVLCGVGGIVCMFIAIFMSPLVARNNGKK